MTGVALLKRGRPPHDDVLTPAEWRVLAYVQLGRSNPEIADHLGVSVNTVRYHLSNLLAKSERDSRRELVGWRPQGLTGARAAAPFFRGDRVASLRGLLSQPEADAFGLSASDLLRLGADASDSEAPLFSGTVDYVAHVAALENETLTLALAQPTDLHPGDWAAINGVRLIIHDAAQRRVVLDLPDAARSRTNLGALKPEDGVNFEPARRVTDRLSGHVVSGVVEATAALRALDVEGDAIVAAYETPRELLPRIIEKGRVAVDGVSLTVSERTENGFRISLAPFTRGRTNLADRRLGEQVNIETDVLAHVVDRLIERAIVENTKQTRETGAGNGEVDGDPD